MLRSIYLALGLSVAVAAPIMAFDQGAAGWFYDGNELLERCGGAPSLAEAYISGIADGTQYGAEHANDYEGYRYCSPRGATSRQYRDLVCSYLDDHPGSRQKPAAELTLEALFSAWPCLGSP